MIEKVKRRTRWQRLSHIMRKRWMTSMEQVAAIGTVTPSKVRSEMRANGMKLKARRRLGSALTEYRVE